MRSTLSPEQIAKLPRYVADYVADLREQITRLELQVKQLEAANTGARDSPVMVRHYPTGEMNFGLPKDAQVRFQLGEHWSCYIDASLKGNRVTIHCGAANKELIVRPNASNVLQLGIMPRE